MTVDKPVKIPHIAHLNPRKIICGPWHTLILSESNKIFSTGSNYYGQCGYFPQSAGMLSDDDDEIILTPTRLEALDDIDVSKIATGDFHSIVLSKNGSLHSLYNSYICLFG